MLPAGLQDPDQSRRWQTDFLGVYRLYEGEDPAAPPARPRLLLAALLLALACSLWPLALPGLYLHASANLHDLLIPLNAALILEQGLLPHRDVPSPLGPAFFLQSWVLARIAGGITAESLTLAAPLLLLPVAGLWLLCRARIGDAWLAALILASGVLLASGRVLDEPFDRIHWYGAYNRQGWALLAPLIIWALMLPVPARPPRLWQGLVMGAVTLWLLLFKLNFGLGAAAALALGWGLGRVGRAQILAAGGVALAGLVSLQILWPDLLPAYARDLLQASAAKGGLSLAVQTGPALLLGWGLPVAVYLLGPRPQPLPLLVLALILLWVAAQNFDAEPVFALILPLWLRGEFKGAGRAVAGAGAALLLLAWLPVDLHSLWRLTGRSLSLAPEPAAEAAGPALAGLRLDPERARAFPWRRHLPQSPPEMLPVWRDLSQAMPLSQRDWLWLQADGAALIEAEGLTLEPIGILAFANPWPLLQGMPWPRGEPLWRHVGTTEPEGLVPERLPVMAGLMMPLLDYDPETNEPLRRAWSQALLAQGWCPVAESRLWLLWQPRPEAGCPDLIAPALLEAPLPAPTPAR